MGEGMSSKVSQHAQKMAGERRFLTIVPPKRPTTSYQQVIAELRAEGYTMPPCENCGEDCLVARKEELVQGKYCGSCAIKLGVAPDLPPAA